MIRCLILLLLTSALICCQTGASEKDAIQASSLPPNTGKIPVIFDTDANNELDDQHALAYLLLNQETFDIKGITVNATTSGGAIENHVQEAERIRKLCAQDDRIPLVAGANSDFEQIRDHLDEAEYDGYQAVDFIIEQSKQYQDHGLVLIPVGKLTNIALALQKDPSIAERVRVVWLGSNYPAPGEYNQDNDIPSMNYVLSTSVPFEMVTVRYGEPSGTAAVTVTQAFINEQMPGLGPQVDVPVEGRHGGKYQTFGDYAVSLFEHIDYYNDAKERALFDLAAVAIVKNPSWAEARDHPSPVYEEGAWKEQPDNTHHIVIWENFNRDAIVGDFMSTLEQTSSQ